MADASVPPESPVQARASSPFPNPPTKQRHRIRPYPYEPHQTSASHLSSPGVMMSAALPVLAPRLPGCPHILEEKTYPKEHTEDEWESMRGLIKTLYICDNRKLNETMAILQTRHGFAAT